MSQITIVEIQGELVIDSRLLSEQLGIKHSSLIKLIGKHQAIIEADFGQVRFEIGTVQNSVGAINEVKFAWLNESQALLLMTLSRNTEEVLDRKAGLIKAFLHQRKQLENPVDRKLFVELADRISKLESKSVPALPPVVPELTRSMQVKELVINYVNRMGCEYESAWKLLYTKFGLLYPWKPATKSKKSKLVQIEDAGLIEELYQLALKLFI